jgi:outer membrane protein OmpA-like peptidoglycan-associated protein
MLEHNGIVLFQLAKFGYDLKAMMVIQIVCHAIQWGANLSYDKLKKTSLNGYVKTESNGYSISNGDIFQQIDIRASKKWPLKQKNGLPQFVFVKTLTEKSLTFVDNFPTYSLNASLEFERYSFFNFGICMFDLLKEDMVDRFEDSYLDRYKDENAKEYAVKNDYQFYQQNQTRLLYLWSKSYNKHGAQVIEKVDGFYYSPKLNIGNYDVRKHNDKIPIEPDIKNRESYLNLDQAVIFTWDQSDRKQVKIFPNDYFLDYFTFSQAGYTRAPHITKILEIGLRQKNEDQIDVFDMRNTELSIAAKICVGALTKVQVFSELIVSEKKVGKYILNSIQSDWILDVNDDKKYEWGLKRKPNEFIADPHQYDRYGNKMFKATFDADKWSIVDGEYSLGHHQTHRRSGFTIKRFLSNLINSEEQTGFITGQFRFPDDIVVARRGQAIISVNNIAKQINAVLHLEPLLNCAVIGHTDCTWSNASTTKKAFVNNLDLAQKRANSVVNHMSNLKKSDLGSLSNLMIGHRIKSFSAGMTECKCWDGKKHTRSKINKSWDQEPCRKLSFEFYIKK